MFYLYESIVEPVLLYGSDIWGAYASCTKDIDKIYLWYIRMVLNVKATTCNIITMGESGIIPPTIKCHRNAILYFIRLNNLPPGSVVKNVFLELKQLHNTGFRNWYTNVCELASSYNIDICSYKFSDATKNQIKIKLRSHFIRNWMHDLQDEIKFPILRTYRLIKNEFKFEPYLAAISKFKYRSAMSKLRASSHILEIERGRYTNPITTREQRTCRTCQNFIEDEYHFMMACEIYKTERNNLFSNIINISPNFIQMTDIDKFTFLFRNDNPQILS